jgi:hypothetical protein
MPYCTIEEAWGSNLTSDNSGNRFKKITPENGFTSPQIGYSLDSYPETDIYDQEANSIFSKGKKKKIKRRKTFSRSYNRLPEHSGPKTRLPKKGKKQKRLIIDDTIKRLDSINNHPQYSNLDLPINEYDKLLEEKLNDGYESEESQQTSNNLTENFENKEHYIDFLKSENKKLKNIISEIRNNNYNKNDNLFDLVVFLSAGVFIIFLLETLSKSIRKF